MSSEHERQEGFEASLLVPYLHANPKQTISNTITQLIQCLNHKSHVHEKEFLIFARIRTDIHITVHAKELKPRHQSIRAATDEAI